MATLSPVIHEYPSMGKYKIRLLQGKKGKSLDIREYVSAESFEGFTRRGVLVGTVAELRILQAAVEDAISRITKEVPDA